MANLYYPKEVKRNPAYWLNPSTWWASRRKMFRQDNSNAWRSSLPAPAPPNTPDRSVAVDKLLKRNAPSFRFVVLGDTGEGDWSQYALIPVLRSLRPDFMILNGDVAYPAGRVEDFEVGFFRPYRNLGIPIWAVPGNHEYYSKDKGGTFFATFCTTQFAQRWLESGLKLVPQPGTYWELTGGRLSIIALDTGMCGDLDGKKSHGEDTAQHEWLRRRLAVAEAAGNSVIALFHIPQLVDGKAQGDVYLSRTHALLAASPAVRVVACGHVHNHQYYAPARFAQFLSDPLRASRPSGAAPIEYFVSGGGGAYLSEPPEKIGPFGPDFLFPDFPAWKDYARLAQKAVAKLNLGRSWVARVASLAGSSAQADADDGQYLSGLVVDVDAASATVRQLLMRNLEDLYVVPANTSVEIMSDVIPVDPGLVAGILNLRPPIVI